MSAPRPLHRQLESSADEVRISRMWSRISARRERPPLPRRAAPVAIGVSLAAAAAALLLMLPRETPPSDDAPLALASGAEVPAVEAADAPRALRFEDGSEIRLSTGARLEPFQNDAARFGVLLTRGRARFSVTPGGPRRWVVEAGLATVEVVGTVFTVDRTGDALRVEVERGVVLVRGERVPDRVARLTAGEALSVTAAPEAPAPAAAAPEATAPEAAAPEAPAEEARPARVRAPAPDRSPPSEPPAEADVAALMASADAARARGDARAAASLYRRVSQRRGDPRAAIAAYTLGRLEMDELRRPARARAAFTRALALGLPERLAAQARHRLTTLR